VNRIRLGTRGSKLALWQAAWTARALAALPRGPEVEVVVVKTKGDAVTDRPLDEVGGTGVFVKELEEALLSGGIDLAVHSLKDLETRMPAGIALAAVTARAPVEDCLVSGRPVTLASLPRGARVATGSPRRKALLRDRRPDLVFEPIRGNVPTRVERVVGGAADATVLARAGLVRLEMTAHVREVLDPKEFPPAPGQGALGIQCREGDGDLRSVLALLDDAASRAATTAERAFLRTLGSGCHLAAGAWGRAGDAAGSLLVDAFVGSAERDELLRAGRRGAAADADALGTDIARELLGRASAELRRELAEGGRPRGAPAERSA
jgi:hydroxymethylbilane synthase